jgi:hypothetical protein
VRELHPGPDANEPSVRLSTAGRSSNRDGVVSVAISARTFGSVIGLQVTLYNPDMDGEGASGRGLAATLVEALGSRHGS